MRTLCLLLLATAASGQTLAGQVNEAIDRGVDRLRGWQKPDGSFSSGYAKNYPMGPTSLAVYAMAKSQVPADDAALQRALAYLARQEFLRTYGTATLLMALDALKQPDRHRARMHAGAKWLERNIEKGFWNYGPESPHGHNKYDLSNTQFAALGLWAAERNGYKAKKSTWREMGRRVPRLQRKGGGFAYRADRVETGSMTTAGITVLTRATQRLARERRAKWHREARRSIESAWTYLDASHQADRNPMGAKGKDKHSWLLYHLYGIERAASLWKRKEIGGRDWYVDGARHLLRTQKPSGAWNDLVDTSFALLFLRRATFTTLEAGAPPATGKAQPVVFDEVRKPAPDVPFLRRWLVAGPFAEEREPQTWKPFRSAQGRIDLDYATKSADKVFNYAQTYLHVAHDTKAVLWTGHDDGAVVWLDGKEIHRNDDQQATTTDQYKAELDLTKGLHLLRFRVYDHGGVTGMVARLAARNGAPLRGVTTSLSNTDQEPAANAKAHPERFTLAQLAKLLPIDETSVLDGSWNSFRRPAFAHAHPRWIREKPQSIRLEPTSDYRPARLYWRVRVPKDAGLFVRVAPEKKEKVDVGLRVGVYDGKLRWLVDEVLTKLEWHTFEKDVADLAGRDVLLVVEVYTVNSRWYEFVYLDELALR